MGAYNALLEGYSLVGGEAREHGEWEAEAERLLAQMRLRGLRPDEGTYNALIDLNQFEPERMLAVLIEMKEARVAPGRRTYTQLARHLRAARRA